jgi:hypothetical protein
MSQKKARKSLQYIWQSCVATKRNPNMLSSGKDDDADTERKAIIAPSQQTQNIDRC